MAGIRIQTTTGAQTTIDDAALEAFRAGCRGELLTAESPGYDDARTIWNAMIDRRPALLLRCAGTADVMRAVSFARDNSLALSVRGAGHNIAGSAVCEGGLMIDLSRMTSVRVDPAAKRAEVEPGVTLADLDHETQAFGLTVPVGINSTTGIAGLTLGGGIGWLSRKFGMTVDSLIGADVVTASGKLVRASALENPDLFWGIRGGGGNFGIVTRFDFRLHEFGPNVYAGLVVYPFDPTGGILKKYRAFAEAAPDDVTSWIVLRTAPPLPFLPPDIHGRNVIVFTFVYTGDSAGGSAAAEPLRHFGDRHWEHTGEMPFTAWQKAFDPLLAPGMRNYWKTHNFASLSDDVIATALAAAAQPPSPHCEVLLGQSGGQASRVAADATAYPLRTAGHFMNVHARWEHASEDESCIGWARGLFRAAEPYATGGAYVNFMTQDEAERLPSAYGENTWKRLAALKRTWDPTNLFRMNQNVAPAT